MARDRTGCSPDVMTNGSGIHDRIAYRCQALSEYRLRPACARSYDLLIGPCSQRQSVTCHADRAVGVWSHQGRCCVGARATEVAAAVGTARAAAAAA